MNMRYSGLQQDVLSLYRSLLRSAKRKDPNNQHNLVSFVKSEFRAKAHSVKKTDFRTIEHMLRHGVKQKKLMEMPGFSAARTTLKESV